MHAAIPAALKSRGWSDARAFSSTQLKKNPNTFFYRHVAPHEQQVCERVLTHTRHGMLSQLPLADACLPAVLYLRQASAVNIILLSCTACGVCKIR